MKLLKYVFILAGWLLAIAPATQSLIESLQNDPDLKDVKKDFEQHAKEQKLELVKEEEN